MSIKLKLLLWNSHQRTRLNQTRMSIMTKAKRYWIFRDVHCSYLNISHNIRYPKITISLLPLLYLLNHMWTVWYCSMLCAPLRTLLIYSRSSLLCSCCCVWLWNFTCSSLLSNNFVVLLARLATVAEILTINSNTCERRERRESAHVKPEKGF